MKQRARSFGETTLLVLAVSLAAFLLMRAMPGDAAEAILFSRGIAPTPELVEAARREVGLDQPLAMQFLEWVWRLLHGDLGVSHRSGAPIMATLLEKLPVSLTIGFGGLILGAALAFALALATVARTAGFERGTRFLAVAVQAVPAFALGLGVIWLFGVELKWIRPFTGGWLERIVLPMLLVATYTCGALVRVLRLEMMRAMEAPFARAARAKGLSDGQLVWSHASPFGLVALSSALRSEAAWVIGGTATAEVLFGAPGVSAWVVEAVGMRDYGVVQAYVLTVILWMLIVHAALDAASRRLDPRRAV